MKILVIEDQLPLLQQIEKLICNEGYVCEIAFDFKSAWEKVWSYKYDLLVVDINLPDGSGLEIIHKVKNEHPKTAIIVISARDSTANKIEGLEIGADDYITKPFEMSELLARIKSVLRSYFFQGDSSITFGDITLDPNNQTV